MDQVTAIGGGGSQHTGSQQSTGAQHRPKNPKQPASAVVGAANESMATAMHPVINPRKVFICVSHVGRWDISFSLSSPVVAGYATGRVGSIFAQLDAGPHIRRKRTYQISLES